VLNNSDFHKTIQFIYEWAKEFNPFQHTGCVIVDHKFNRTEILSPMYVALRNYNSRMPPNILSSNCLDELDFIDLLRTNHAEELLAYFPELNTKFQRVLQIWDSSVQHIEQVWFSLSNQDFKSYNEEAKKYWFCNVLFKVRKYPYLTIGEYLALLSETQFQRMIKYKIFI